MREELRKVQSSAAILNHQRGPGVGYWSSANNAGTNIPPSTTSSQIAGPDSSSDHEDVNVEYLRNVILQFLEHKEMRVGRLSALCVHADGSFSAESGSGAVDHSTIHSTRNP